jgi:hypothetical protein
MRVNIRFLKWLLVPVLGYIAFVLPVLISHPAHHYGGVLFQTYTDARYTLGWSNVLFLFLLGVGLGFFVTEREAVRPMPPAEMRPSRLSRAKHPWPDLQ